MSSTKQLLANRDEFSGLRLPAWHRQSAGGFLPSPSNAHSHYTPLISPPKQTPNYLDTIVRAPFCFQTIPSFNPEIFLLSPGTERRMHGRVELVRLTIFGWVLVLEFGSGREIKLLKRRRKRRPQVGDEFARTYVL